MPPLCVQETTEDPTEEESEQGWNKLAGSCHNGEVHRIRHVVFIGIRKIAVYHFLQIISARVIHLDAAKIRAQHLEREYQAIALQPGDGMEPGQRDKPVPILSDDIAPQRDTVSLASWNV